MEKKTMCKYARNDIFRVSTPRQNQIIKEVLRAMNIDIVEMEGYEADDVLGTLSRYGENNGLEKLSNSSTLLFLSLYGKSFSSNE